MLRRYGPEIARVTAAHAGPSTKTSVAARIAETGFLTV